MAVAVLQRGPISERYRPHRLDEVLGPPQSRRTLRAWAAEWNSGRTPSRRAVVLSGPPGVGKTSTALALAEEMGWSLVEMNASDARNEAAIQQVAGRASITHTLEEAAPGAPRRRALILLDEADCLTGKRNETPRPATAPLSLPEFLRGRYRTIEALNAAWGLGDPGHPGAFESWGHLPRSPGRAAWTKLAPAQRDLGDWKSVPGPSDLSDRGGLGAIVKLVRTTRQPLVLTVNDESVLTRYSAVFRSSVIRIRFERLGAPDLSGHLVRIAGREGIRLAPGAVEAIVKKARGDLRAALNDLEAVAPLPPGPAQLTVLGARDLTSDLEELTDEALTAHRYYRSVEVRDRLDAPPDDLFPWVEENLPGFSPDLVHLDAAFRVLAAADLLLQRARRARVWSLWSYASELMTGGVSVSIRDAPVPLRGRVYFPEFLGGMGGSRVARGLREAVVQKAGRRLHLSKRKARFAVLPFLEALTWVGAQPKARPELLETARRVVAELDLAPEEVAYLIGSDVESPSTQRLIEAEEETSPLGPPPPPEAAEPDGEPPKTPPSPATPKRVQRSLSDFGA